MYTYTVYKVITDMKELKPPEGKGGVQRLDRKISVISRGVEGFFVSFWPQSCSQRCFKRKTPQLTFRLQSKTDRLVKKRMLRGEEFTALLRNKKRLELALFVEIS